MTVYYRPGNRVRFLREREPWKVVAVRSSLRLGEIDQFLDLDLDDGEHQLCREGVNAVNVEMWEPSDPEWKEIQPDYSLNRPEGERLSEETLCGLSPLEAFNLLAKIGRVVIADPTAAGRSGQIQFTDPPTKQQVVTSVDRKAFEQKVNTALEEGWRVVPGTLRMDVNPASDNCVVVLEIER